MPNQSNGRTALVVPSIREVSFKRFVNEWRPTGLFDRVDLVVMEDNPTKTFQTPLEAIKHFCWQDIDKESWAHIIPRRSDTVRSFAYHWVWANGYENLATMDDDCYPAKGYERWDEMHLQMLTRTKWFNTLNSVRPRGVPYFNTGKRDVHINHGIWQGCLDYDAPQQLVDPVPETYTHDNRIVPHGAYFPFCGMNVVWRREAIVLSYHLLMGQIVKDLHFPHGDIHKREVALEKLPFDRWGDIACGIIMKKICDHLHWAVSTGTPYIHHDRASDPFTNLRKEAAVLEINEWLWQEIDKIDLGSSRSAVECYSMVGNAVRNFGSCGQKSASEYTKYFQDLGSAMMTWANLFE